MRLMRAALIGWRRLPTGGDKTASATSRMFRLDAGGVGPTGPRRRTGNEHGLGLVRLGLRRPVG